MEAYLAANFSSCRRDKGWAIPCLRCIVLVVVMGASPVTSRGDTASLAVVVGRSVTTFFTVAVKLLAFGTNPVALVAILVYKRLNGTKKKNRFDDFGISSLAGTLAASVPHLANSARSFCQYRVLSFVLSFANPRLVVLDLNERLVTVVVVWKACVERITDVMHKSRM